MLELLPGLPGARRIFVRAWNRPTGAVRLLVVRHRSAVVGAGTAVLIAITGCTGALSDPIIREPPPPPPYHHLAFPQRAALVLAGWRSSGAQRLWPRGLGATWFTGLVLLEGAQLTMESDMAAGESLPCDAVCYEVVRYRLASPLPPAPTAPGTVRFPGQARPLPVPLIPPAAALRSLPLGDRSACAGPGVLCLTVSITHLSLGSVTVRASRGEASVPAWEFSFTRQGFAETLARIAVAPGYLEALPNWLWPPPPDAGYARIMRIAASPADPRRVTVWVRVPAGETPAGETPAGEANLRVEAYQSPAALVLGALISPAGPPGSASAHASAHATTRRLTLTLAAPAGQRAVLDARTGLPIP
jgi:hypothetical protein